MTTAFDLDTGEDRSVLELPHPEIETLAQVRARSFEFSCRGERVPLERLEPDGKHGAPAGPVLLVQPDPAEDGGLVGLTGLRSWLGAGATVASITLPLFGARRSPKMTSLLESTREASRDGRAIDTHASLLWQEFTRQAVLELRAAVDVLTELGGAPRILFAGAGLGASIGAIFCAVDPRPERCFLSAPERHGPDGVDPSPYLAELAEPRCRVDDAREDLLPAARRFLND